ncbi:MAG: DUF3883 domain-containing protein [Chloroflexi bacterium]|nr:DUF3883 domain-containing protein [Chloroflexota bacterium]
MREFLAHFQLRDGRYEFTPTSSQNLEYSGLRNLLIDLDFLYADPVEVRYAVDYDAFQEYLEAHSTRGLSLAQFQSVQNRREEIGRAAELQVIEYEKQRLSQFPDLASRIEHIALKDVSAGYDIMSFNWKCADSATATPRLIEVKAVSPSRYSFMWTRNEMRKSMLDGEKYYLYLLPVKGKNTFDQEGLRIIQDPYTNLYMNDKEWSRTIELLSFVPAGGADTCTWCHDKHHSAKEN